jgi:hypothetical protein
LVGRMATSSTKAGAIHSNRDPDYLRKGVPFHSDGVIRTGIKLTVDAKW